jgi:hypothetical protein
MSTSNQTTGPSRAQGNQRLPWPSEFTGEPSDCLIGMRVEVTDDLPDGDVEPVSDIGAIAVGDPADGLCSMARIARGLEPDHRPTLIGEVRALGWIDPSCPLKIERVFFRDGRTVHVEATVLPVSDAQLDELTTLMSEEADQGDSHTIALLYIEQLERPWRSRSANGELPLCWLDGPTATVTSIHHNGATPQPQAALAAA